MIFILGDFVERKVPAIFPKFEERFLLNLHFVEERFLCL